MTEQQIKEILSNRFINAAAVAVQVLPELKPNSAKKTFLMKLNGAKYYTLTDADLTNAATVLETFGNTLRQTGTTEQAIKTALNNPILKRSAIAERLYPNFRPKAASANFANKLNPRQTDREFTPEELQQIRAILLEISELIPARIEPAEQDNGGAKNFLEMLNGGKIDPNIFLPKKREPEETE